MRFDPALAAQRLVAARHGAPAVGHAQVLAPDRAMAYAVQDATLSRIGPPGGWKVGAAGPTLEPACAPLPACGIKPSGARLAAAPDALRGIEVEVGLLLGRDLLPGSGAPHPDTVRDAVQAVHPVIEVVETRLADWRDSDPLAQLADLQSHGALILGPAAPLPPDLDLRSVQAFLAFDRQPVASARGANPAEDLWRLLGWLAWHCMQRGQPLRAGQIVTTGSCSGMLFAPEGAHVQAQLEGIGMVELQFE